MFKTFLGRPLVSSLLLFAFSCLIGLSVFQKELNTNGDNGAYLCFAISLAKGDGFRLPNLPDHPTSSQFPLIFPLFLAVFIKLFGYHLFLLKTVMLAVFGVSMALFLRLARSFLSGRLLYAAVVLTVSNFWLLDNASITMSELTFMLFLLSGAILLRRYDADKGDIFLLLAAACLLLSPFVRTVGLAAVLALLFYLASRRRYVAAAAALAAFTALYFAHKHFMEPGNGYFATLFLREPYRPEMGGVTFVEFFQRVWDNVLFYSLNTVEMTLLSFMSEGSLTMSAGSLLFTGLSVAVLFLYPPRLLLKDRPALFMRVLVLLYMGVLFSWPKVWSGSRFIVPIIPFIFLIAFQNIRFLLNRFLKAMYLERAEKLIAVIASLWAVLNYGAIYKKAHEPLTSDWRDYYSLAEWAGKNIPDSSVVCARSPFLFYLKSGRLCRPIPVTDDREKALDYLKEKRVRYVLIDRFKWTGSTQVYVAPLLQAYPEKFRLVAEKKEAALFLFSP
jgi:hypothetical protein